MTTFSISGPGFKAEGTGGTTPFNFTVTRSADLSGNSIVDYWLWPFGVGSSGEPDTHDFSGATTGSVYFQAGESAKTITVNVVADAAIELNETFNISLSNPRGGTIATGAAQATIVNDDSGGTGPTSVSISDLAPKAEGTGGPTLFLFDITRSGDLSGSSLVDYWLWPMSGGGPGVADQFDFEGPTTGTIYFSAGEATRQLQVAVRGDSALEPNETFNVGLSNPRGTVIGDGAAHTTIVNDDGGASTTLSWGNPGGVHKNEGSQTSNNPPTEFVYVLNRTGDISGTTTADWTVIRGPVDENDFTALPFGQVSFAPGEVSKNIVLRVNGDLTVEPDEAFRLVVGNVVGGTTPPENSGTIINDDGGGTGPTSVSISGSIERAEGDSGTTAFDYTVVRSGDASGFTLVDWYVIGDPQPGTDFTGGTGTLYFQAGETQKTIRLSIIGDTTPEPNEAFTIGLSNPRGGSIGSAHAHGRILDDDGWVVT